jgi:hypothetical protein
LVDEINDIVWVVGSTEVEMGSDVMHTYRRVDSRRERIVAVERTVVESESEREREREN